jgi:hypothetical protein
MENRVEKMDSSVERPSRGFHVTENIFEDMDSSFAWPSRGFAGPASFVYAGSEIFSGAKNVLLLQK